MLILVLGVFGVPPELGKAPPHAPDPPNWAVSPQNDFLVVFLLPKKTPRRRRSSPGALTRSVQPKPPLCSVSFNKNNLLA